MIPGGLMMKKMFGARIAPLMALASLAFAAQANELTIGSKAPELKVAKFVKGKPVKDLSKGTYVVEFWATWCGPCKASIPHLTEMAQGEFKNKVTFIGVSVWEKAKGETGTGYMKKVEDFVKEWGDKMNYTVAIDGENDWMSNNWLRPAGQNGIPASFIVKDGQIVWIGHPMGGLDEALRKIQNGTYNLAEEQEKMRKAQEQEAEYNKLMQPIMEARNKGDFKTAIQKLDEAMAAGKAKGMDLSWMEGMRFEFLLGSDEKAAYEYAAKRIENPKIDAAELNSMAWAILDTKTLKHPDYKLALAIAEKGVKAMPDDGMIMDTYALALFKNGKKSEAIAAQEKAIQLVKAMKDAPADLIKAMEDRLAEFKKS
jgi:thiol-disulfide isomerase/thioredoxin